MSGQLSFGYQQHTHLTLPDEALGQFLLEVGHCDLRDTLAREQRKVGEVAAEGQVSESGGCETPAALEVQRAQRGTRCCDCLYAFVRYRVCFFQGEDLLACQPPESIRANYVPSHRRIE